MHHRYNIPACWNHRYPAVTQKILQKLSIDISLQSDHTNPRSDLDYRRSRDHY